MKHFWNWVQTGDERVLTIEGPIAQESWFDDDVTPAEFQQELESGTGPIKLHINSPGGDCAAASMIYSMLMDYPYDVDVQIDSLAASAASVIAMAGTTVRMSPTAMMMIHNPLTMAIGDVREMQKAVGLLDEVKESIINAYEIKTGLSRVKLAHMMDDETWMSANKALELGFCDEVLYTGPEQQLADYSFSPAVASADFVQRVLAKAQQAAAEPETPEPDTDPTDNTDDNRVSVGETDKRLEALKYI